MNATTKNPVDDIWNNAIETLRIEIDQTLNGTRLLALHRKKFNRVSNELSLFTKKLPLFSEEQRILNQDEFKTFNELYTHLSNLNRMIDNYSDFNAVKTIQSVGFNTIKLTLSFLIDFIFTFNLLTNKLELPEISVDKKALRDIDQVEDIICLLNFLKILNIYDVSEASEKPTVYSQLINEGFSYLESHYSGYEETDDICLRRSLFLSREKDENFELIDEETDTVYYGKKELLEELNKISNIKIIPQNDIEIKSSRCFHHGTNADIYLGLIKSTKRIVSVELFHSLIFTEEQFTSFLKKVRLLSKLNYFSIIPLIGVLVDSSICLITEFMPMNSLYESIHGSRKSKLLNGAAAIIDEELMISSEVNNQMPTGPSIPSTTQLNLLYHHMSHEHMSADSYELAPKDISYESQQTVIALGIAYAMRYLHSMDIVHMSLRASEIYLDANGRPKLKCNKHAKAAGSRIDAINFANVEVWTPPELIDSHFHDNEADLDDDNFDEEASQQKKLYSLRKPRLSKESSCPGDLRSNDIGPLSLPLPTDLSQPDFTESEDSLAMSSARATQDIIVDKKIDVYAYGILLWELFTKDWAFAGLTPQLIAKEVLENDQRPLLPQNCPRNLAKLIQSCWQSDPKKRPTFDDICQMIETGNYNFPGTDPVDLSAYISYCNRIEKRPRRKSTDSLSLKSPGFYDNPHLTVSIMIEKFVKEGSADNLEFIENLYKLVQKSSTSSESSKNDLLISIQNDRAIFPKLSDLVPNVTEDFEEETSYDEAEVSDSNSGNYIFNRSSLILISSYFLSPSLSARLIALELCSFIYSNRLFDDENSLSVLVPNLIRNINQMNYLFSLTSSSQIEESQKILNGSLKLLSILLNLSQEPGLLINKTNAPSFNSFINLLFSSSASVRNFALDFYNCFLSKYQPSNNLLMRYITKFVIYATSKLSNKEITKILRLVKFLLQNERSYTLFSIDEKAINTFAHLLAVSEQNDNDNLTTNSLLDDTDDAINMSGKRVSFKINVQYKSDTIIISCLSLLLNLATNTNYLKFYQKLAEPISRNLKSTNKNISTLSCAFLARIIPSIGQSDTNADFSFLTDGILRELSEDLDIYRLRLFGSLTTTFRSAQVNLRLDELILERIHQKIRVSLKPVSMTSQKVLINSGENSKLLQYSGENSNLHDNSNDGEYYEEEEEEEDEDEGDFAMKTVEIPNLKDTSNSIVTPSGSIRSILHANSFEQREIEKEGRLAALILESQASQTPWSRILLEAIDTFFEYFFTLRRTKDRNYKDSRSKRIRRPSYFESDNYKLTLEDEEKCRECFVFLSNISVDPNAALKIFDRIEEFISAANPNNAMLTTCFFNVLLTFEVSEKIRSIMSDKNKISKTKHLIMQLVNKCIEFLNSDYVAQAARVLEMLSSIPNALKIMIEMRVDDCIKNQLKQMIIVRNSEQLHLNASYIQIQQEKKTLKQLEKVLREIEEEQLVTSRMSPRRNGEKFNSSRDFDRSYEENLQNLHIRQNHQQQINKQQQKIYMLQSKELEKKAQESYLKVLYNRILSRIMFE